MKKSFRYLCFLLVFAMLFLTLFSCSAEEEAYSDSETLLDETVDNTKFPILKDGEYVVKVVMPDAPSSAEKAVCLKLCSALYTKTDVRIESKTDYLKKGESRNMGDYVILIGQTNYAESTSVYGKTSANSYGIEIVSKKRMVFYFSTQDEGMKLVTALISAINNDERGYYWVESSFSVKKTTNFKLENVPEYTSSATKSDCGDETVMYTAKSTNLSSYEKYCETLKSRGYSEYSKRDNINGNYYRIYTKGTTAINVSFTKSTSTVKIIAGPIDDIPSKETGKASGTGKNISITMLSQGEENDCGLGLIIRLENGKLIVFDGGFDQQDKLYKKLAALTPAGSRITIAAWFITHPHNDHQDAVTAFLSRYASMVDVENLLYNYAPADVYKNTTQESNPSGVAGMFENLESVLKNKLDRTTNIIKPHTGQVYNFGSVSAEILYTVEDVLPSKLDYVNSSSMVVRFTAAGQTILALADTTHSVSTILQNTYGSYLKSDMVQLAHHGTYPGHASLYTKIGAQVLFWPSNTANAKAQYSDSAVKEALAKAKDVYLSKDTDVTLNLPYTVKNNKSEFLKSIGKK